MADHPAHDPAFDYPEASRRIEELRAAEGDDINPLARTMFLSHGHKTDRAIILLHGYTSSPRMYRLIAEQLHAQGMNVLVPLAPLHGRKDRMTDALAGLDEPQLIAFVNEMADIAHGIGVKVGVAGFSMGGVLALWAARWRHDLDFVGVISPAMSYRFLPESMTAPVFNLLRALPNRFLWWDRELKADMPPLSHGYPRYGTRGIAAFTTLGCRLRSQSLGRLPGARRVLFVINPSDEALNNARALEICRSWMALDSGRTRLFEFDQSWGLRHDFMDPEQRDAQPERVTPVMVDLLSGEW